MKYRSFKLRLNSVREKGVFSGYASTFNHVDSQNDTIKHGAFTDSLKKRSLVLLWQHSTYDPIGKITEAVEDNFGLYVTAFMDLEVLKAKEAYSMIQNRVITSLSIGYIVLKSRTNIRSGIRTIIKADLWEISLVTLPSNSHAVITPKALPFSQSLITAIRKVGEIRHELCPTYST